MSLSTGESSPELMRYSLQSGEMEGTLLPSEVAERVELFCNARKNPGGHLVLRIFRFIQSLHILRHATIIPFPYISIYP